MVANNEFQRPEFLFDNDPIVGISRPKMYSQQHCYFVEPVLEYLKYKYLLQIFFSFFELSLQKSETTLNMKTE